VRREHQDSRQSPHFVVALIINVALLTIAVTLAVWASRYSTNPLFVTQTEPYACTGGPAYFDENSGYACRLPRQTS
jgi:hypothetical protein